MNYELEPVGQLYGDQRYLAHKLKGATPESDRYFFGQRIPSFGTINFGAVAAGQTKSFRPVDHDIISDLMIVSIFDFTTSPTGDELTFRLIWAGTELLEQKMSNDEIPYTFPPGAIINPNITIEVTPRYDSTQILIAWQPVHLLHYHEVQ